MESVRCGKCGALIPVSASMKVRNIGASSAGSVQKGSFSAMVGAQHVWTCQACQKKLSSQHRLPKPSSGVVRLPTVTEIVPPHPPSSLPPESQSSSEVGSLSSRKHRARRPLSARGNKPTGENSNSLNVEEKGVTAIEEKKEDASISSEHQGLQKKGGYVLIPLYPHFLIPLPPSFCVRIPLEIRINVEKGCLTAEKEHFEMSASHFERAANELHVLDPFHTALPYCYLNAAIAFCHLAQWEKALHYCQPVLLGHCISVPLGKMFAPSVSAFEIAAFAEWMCGNSGQAVRYIEMAKENVSSLPGSQAEGWDPNAVSCTLALNYARINASVSMEEDRNVNDSS